MTPETIARIRAMAVTCVASRIAADLGWDAARVLRVARDVGIEVRKDFLAAASVSPSHQIVAAKLDCASLPELYRKLSSVQVRVLRMLEAADDFVSAYKISECTGMSRETVVRSLPQIECTLHGTRWRIESLAARNGGYRLVEVAP